MAVAPPPPVSFNPFKRVALELAAERRAGGMPPGDTLPSVSRTRAMIRNPLGLLLDLYERRGPVFSVRVLHANNVFVLGPEANHFVLVSGAKHFGWRDGGFGDLIPLLGDGLLTIDGDFHRSSRRTMLPAFHRERIAGYRDDDGGGGAARAGGPLRRRDARRLRAGRARSRCGSRCGRCSASIRTPAAAPPTPRATSSARCPSTARTTGCRCCAARAPRTRG